MESEGVTDRAGGGGGVKSAPPRAGSPPGGGIRLWQMMLAVAVIALILWAAIGFLVLMFVFGILLAPALVAGPAIVIVARRTSRQEAFVSLLAMAVEKGVPPGPAIEAFADLCGGGYRRKLLAVAEHLDYGDALPDALARVPGAVPRGALGGIRVGWEAGSVARALRDVEAAGASWRPHRQGLVKALAYGLGMLMVVQVICGFIMYYIAPQFVKIFADFKQPLPRLTLAVFRTGDILTRFWPVTLAGTLLEGALIVLLGGLLIEYVGGPEVKLPLIDRLARRRHAAVILRSLALVVDAGRPLALGLESLARHYPNAAVRRRLGRAEGRARGGEDWLKALRGEGLIRAVDAAVLDSAQRAGGLAWALRELAEGAERRLNYRLQAWSQALFPVVVLAVGSLIGLIVTAYFLPLVALIEDLVG